MISAFPDFGYAPKAKAAWLICSGEVDTSLTGLKPCASPTEITTAHRSVSKKGCIMS